MSFNPVKESSNGRADRVQWSTRALELALKGLERGQRLVANPFYENKIKLLKGDLVFMRTEEEIEEWKRCREDILYFANTYCKLMTPEGIRNITLRDYQVEYLKHLQDHRLSIFLACRQCGKTTTSAIFMLWYILFNIDKNSLVLGNKRKTAVEILDKTKKIFEELPYFLKPGVYKWNESEIVLDNGCRCMAEATTINSGISFTFHCVLADEFAHIQPNIKESFYSNLFPVITAGKARFMITSTQNGPDLFCQLYTAAVNGESEYAPFKVDWWQVPEWDEASRSFIPRTEDWHRVQVGNLGSEEAFQKQFGTEFTIGSDTLITGRVITEQSVQAERFVSKDLPGVDGNQYFLWKPDYDVENLRHDYLLMTIDIAEGIKQDYTVMTINKLIDVREDIPVTETIGYFRTNTKNDAECCRIIYDFLSLYCSKNRFLISLEYNLYGELWINHFRNLIEQNMNSGFDMDNFVRYYSENMKQYHYGVRISSKTKSKACRLFKNYFERGLIINRSLEFNSELRNFSDVRGTGSFKAAIGHDDLVMSQMQLVLAEESLQFTYLKEDFMSNTSTGEDSGNIDFYSEMNNYGSIYDNSGYYNTSLYDYSEAREWSYNIMKKDKYL